MPAVQMIESELAALLIVDVQDKMLPAIRTVEPDRLVSRIEKLIRACALLDVPILYTEHYPQGLGTTDVRLRTALAAHAEPIVKTTCSCWRNESFRRALQLAGREHVILTGVETHVCIQQTTLDLIRMDFIPFVAADACGSRGQEDADLALRRMAHAGAEVTSTEAILFELIERCDHPQFKEVLKLIK